MKNSELIYSRLIEEANAFAMPEKRIGTLERLKSACDAIESGVPIPVAPGEKYTFRKSIQKINPSNIHRCVKAKGWSGPTRSFIANKANGLLGYVTAREEERVGKNGGPPKPLPTQIESLLSEIDSVELRQVMRNQIERRRTAEQEVKIIKEAIKKLPQIDVRGLFEERVTTEKMEEATLSNQGNSTEELQKQVRKLVERLAKPDLRHLGLKRSGADIVSMINSPVVLDIELRALAEIAGLPASLLPEKKQHE